MLLFIIFFIISMWSGWWGWGWDRCMLRVGNYMDSSPSPMPTFDTRFSTLLFYFRKSATVRYVEYILHILLFSEPHIPQENYSFTRCMHRTPSWFNTMQNLKTVLHVCVLLVLFNFPTDKFWKVGARFLLLPMSEMLTLASITSSKSSHFITFITWMQVSLLLAE